MKTNDRCPRCNKEINLNKPYSLLQKWENKKALKYATKMMGGEMPKDMPVFKNYYCPCGLHITFVKQGNKWVWVTAS